MAVANPIAAVASWMSAVAVSGSMGSHLLPLGGRCQHMEPPPSRARFYRSAAPTRAAVWGSKGGRAPPLGLGLRGRSAPLRRSRKGKGEARAAVADRRRSSPQHTLGGVFLTK